MIIAISYCKSSLKVNFPVNDMLQEYTGITAWYKQIILLVFLQ